jgi:adenylate cyclase
MERRLAAILAADMVGYSRLMAADEAGTISRQKTHHTALIDPKVAQYGGRIVKTTGDGMLVEFSSVVDAVQCGVEIQRAMAEREAKVPAAKRIRHRVGINLGDIIIDDDDILGDGVNLAARLEGLSEPEGVCISDVVYQNVVGKLDLTFNDLGEQALKNMARKVRAWSWTDSPNRGAGTSEPMSATLPLPDKPSIAVLPFTNMSGDANQEYFSDGITEDIITELSRSRNLFVIARNSSFQYKGQSPRVQEIGRELGVQYVVEGSVRKAGNRIRITVQVVEAESGNHIWAERYDRDLDDIFSLQDEMTQTIVGAVEPELSAAERERAVRKPPESLDAWETYQRGLWHLLNFTKDDNAKAQIQLRRAQSLDPRFATAYAYEAYSHYLDVMLGFAQAPEDSLEVALEAAKKALALDDKDPVAYFAAGRVYMMLGKHDASVAELQAAVGLNPSFALAHHGLGCALMLSDRLQEAADELDKAIRLSPRDPVLWGMMCFHSLNCILMHDYQAAVGWAERVIHEPRSAGGGYWPYAVLSSALGNLGKIKEARSALDEALLRKPDLSLAYLEKTLPTKGRGSLAPYLDGLRKVGLSA